MFACLEIDTDDIILWSKIDQMLSTTLGLTHIVWGAQKDKDPRPCQLPSNLYAGGVDITPSLLTEKISEAVKREWNGKFCVFVMKTLTWSRRSEEGIQPSVAAVEPDYVNRET